MASEHETAEQFHAAMEREKTKRPTGVNQPSALKGSPMNSTNVKQDEAGVNQMQAFDSWMMSLRQSPVPAHLHAGLAHYFAQRIQPGSFLTAVLENNLLRAAAVADPSSRDRLCDVVDFLYRHAPLIAWGSEALVAEWVKGRTEP